MCNGNGSRGWATASTRTKSGWLGALCTAMLLFTIGCEDNFECGVASGGGIAACTGAGEVCLCSVRRCAEPARTEDGCDSGLRYRFKRTRGTKAECVEFPETMVLVSGATLCPTAANPDPPCGQLGDAGLVTCGASQNCVCRTRRCARPDPTYRCETGYAWASDNQCVGQARKSCPSGLAWPDGTCIERISDLPPAATVEREFLLPGQNLCTLPRPPDQICGSPTGLADAGVPGCPGAERCICGDTPGESFRCAREVNTDRCPSQLAWSYTGECVPPPLQASQPGYFQTGPGGLCGELSVAPQECGGPLDGGVCTSDQTCLCRTRRCVVRVAPGVCASGFLNVTDGRCAERLSRRCSSGYAWPDGECIPAVVNGDAGPVPLFDGGILAPATSCPTGFAAAAVSDGGTDAPMNVDVDGGVAGNTQGGM